MSPRTLSAVLVICATSFLAPCLCAQSPAATHLALSTWHYQADWTAGYAGWMSFPLSQDVGYDPSIYTEKNGEHTVLVRNFTAHGQRTAWFGFVRPLRFEAGPRTSVEIDYNLRTAGAMADASLILGAADGHHYSCALPTGNGNHRVRVTAVQLGIKVTTSIEVIILRGRLLRPPAGSESDWIVREFVLKAERPRTVSISRPELQHSTDGGAVAATVVRPRKSLDVDWINSNAATAISLYDPSGAVAIRQQIAAGTGNASVPLPPDAPPGLWRVEVAQANARSEFNFFVSGAVPPHPRLLLSEARLEQLRGSGYTMVRKQVHARASQLAHQIGFREGAGENIARMPSGPGIEPAFPNQLRPYLQLMASYSDAIAYNALDYRLNDNAAALASARRALMTMIHWETWVPPRFRAHGLQTYYEVGVAAQLVAFGYDLIADHLSEQDKQAVEQAFWTQVIAPTVQEYFTADRDPIAASNWMANSLGGALACAVAVAGDTPEWDRRDAPAVGELEYSFERLLRGLFPGDGSEAEPIGYENFAMQGLSWGMSALRALQVTPRGAERMIDGFWWPYYATVAPGMQLDTGDFNGHLTKLPGFAWGAEYGGIPELRAFYRSATQLDLSQGAPVGENGHFLEEMPGPLDLVCCTAPAKPFPPPPPSRVFPKRGSAVLRSGWDRDATVISLRVGPWFNHEHHDEGSFQVAAFGDKLVDEAGYASYYTDPRYPDYFTQAPGHNTVLVDRDPFSQQAFHGRYWPGFKHPHFDSQVLASGFDYLRADLTSAYDGKLQSYIREYFFVRPGLLLVRDRIQASQPHIFSWLLHTPPGAVLTSDHGAASIATQHAAASLLALGANAGWNTQTTPLPISLFDNLDKPRIPDRREFVLTSPQTAGTEFTVAMYFTRKSNAAGSSMEAWKEPAGEGVRVAGDQPANVVFRTAPGPLRISNLSTDGSALLTTTGSVQGWMAVAARSIEDGGRTVVRSAVPVDFAMEHVGTAVQITVHNETRDSIEIYSQEKPNHVQVDGKEILIMYRGTMLVLALSNPGEHHVSIQ